MIYILCFRSHNWFTIIRFSFGTDSIQFACRYARSVTAASDVSISPQTNDPIIGNGDLTYSMNIAAGELGGNSQVTISPTHDIAGVGARLVIVIFIPTYTWIIL